MSRMFLPFVVAFGTATDALLRHPLRALLTCFGILVGVFSVTIVMTLGEGAERSVQEKVEQMGENLLTVRARHDRASGASDTMPILTEADGEAIASSVSGLSAVAPTLDGLVRAVYGQENLSVQVVGTNSHYFAAQKYKIEEGTTWEKSDEQTGARVLLVGPTVVEELFGRGEAVGESVRIGRHLFRVIGVLSEKGQTPFGNDLDKIMVMPIMTMRSKISPSRPGEVSQLAIAGEEGADMAAITRSITALLRQRHRIGLDQEDDFSIRDQSRMAQAQRGVIDIMRLLLTCIAMISLFIGGIGVMNIMLVSVAERSKEIGTRLAVGARSFDVLIQFLIEAVVLSLLGGGLGVLLSIILLAPLEAQFGWELSLSRSTLLLALVVSVSTGVIFGLLPARRASQLDPVVALRRE